MKKIILLILLLNISCSSRKSVVDKSTKKLEASDKQDLSQKVESATKSESSFDFSSLSENQNFSIKGGEPYTLNYKGIIYSGSNAIEISNNKAETKISHKTVTLTITKTLTTYRTNTTYKSIDTFKSKQTDRKSYPWYLLVAIGFFLKILVGFAWSKIKISNPYLNLIAKIKTKLS